MASFADLPTQMVFGRHQIKVEVILYSLKVYVESKVLFSQK